MVSDSLAAFQPLRVSDGMGAPFLTTAAGQTCLYSAPSLCTWSV